MFLQVQSVLRPAAANILTPVSTAAGQLEADGSSLNARLSSDGRYVFFESEASNLVAGDTNNASDIFRKDLLTGEIVRISVKSAIDQADGNSSYVQFSANGRYVVFESDATNLVPGGTLGRIHIYYKDLVTGEITRVSAGTEGEANYDCYRPS